MSKLAYFYLHTNTHGNCTGCYRLPPAYISADMRISPDDAEVALRDLERARLIEWDSTEDVVRIEGWWPFNQITNRKHLAAAITAQRDLPRASHLAVQIALEIAGAMLPVAKGWSADGSTKGRAAMLDALNMCQEMLRNALNVAPEEAILRAVNALPIELSEDLSNALSVGLHRFRTETRDGDTDRDTDRDKRQRRVLGPVSAEKSSDVEATIRELNERVRGVGT